MQVGLAVNDPHAAVIDAERLGADLRHGGLEALAERGAAGDQLDRAGAVDRNLGIVGRPAPALLQKDRDPGPDRLARARGGAPAPAAAPASRTPRAPCRAARRNRRNRAPAPRRRARRTRWCRASAMPRSDCAAAPRCGRARVGPPPHPSGGCARRCFRSVPAPGRWRPASCWSAAHGRAPDRPAPGRRRSACTWCGWAR